MDLSPDGKTLAYVREGDLILMDLESKETRTVLESFETPSYHWSPDSRWLAWSVADDNFNRDVWIAPVDRSRAPYNLSMHPDNDQNPRWDPQEA